MVQQSFAGVGCFVGATLPWDTNVANRMCPHDAQQSLDKCNKTPTMRCDGAMQFGVYTGACTDLRLNPAPARQDQVGIVLELLTRYAAVYLETWDNDQRFVLLLSLLW